MILYRSIGIEEFNTLLRDGKCDGRYNAFKEEKSTCKQRGLVVSFFVDDVWWVDHSHNILLVLDIHDSKLSFGYGEYWASKDFNKTHIWSGRRGSAHYRVKEAYASSYNLTDVRYMSLPNHTEKYLEIYRNILNKYGISEKSYTEMLDIVKKKALNSRDLSYKASGAAVRITNHTLNVEILGILKETFDAKKTTGKYESVYWINKGITYVAYFGGKQTESGYVRTLIVEAYKNREKIDVMSFDINSSLITSIKSWMK